MPSLKKTADVKRKPNTHKKTKIIQALSNMKTLRNVDVQHNKQTDRIDVTYKRVHSLGFVFKWSVDHYVGYTLDAEENKNSQAIVAIHTPAEAFHFVAAYTLLVEIRANRRKALS